MNSQLRASKNTESIKRVEKMGNLIAITPINDPYLNFQTTVTKSNLQNCYKHFYVRSDIKVREFLLMGLLSLLVHNFAVDHFKTLSIEQHKEDQTKPPAKVQITFTKPRPTQSIIQPPKQKVVATKKPQKPLQSPTTKTISEPIQTPNTVSNNTPVLAQNYSSNTNEKATQPRGSAGYKNNTHAEFPEIAIDNGWEGRVILKVHVLPNGKPQSISIETSSGHEILDESAVKTVGQWEFEPAKLGNTPVDGWVSVPINFKLDN